MKHCTCQHFFLSKELILGKSKVKGKSKQKRNRKTKQISNPHEKPEELALAVKSYCLPPKKLALKFQIFQGVEYGSMHVFKVEERGGKERMRVKARERQRRGRK